MNIVDNLFAQIGIVFIQWAVAGLGFLIALAMIWHWRQRRSDIMCETWEMFLPSNKKTEDIEDFFRSVSGVPKPGMLEPAHTITIDRFSDYTGTHTYITTPGRISAQLDELLYQHLDATLEPVERNQDPIRTTVWDKAVELSLRGFNEPLRIGAPEGVAATFEAHLRGVPENHAKNIQIVLVPDRPRTPTADDREKVTG
jgi:hypothetical protein